MLELWVVGAAHIPCGILCPLLGDPLKGVLLARTIPIERYWDSGGTEIMEHEEAWLQVRRPGTM